MSTAIAKNLMAEMKLLGMLAAFDKTLSDATRDQSSHSELIDTLLLRLVKQCPKKVEAFQSLKN